MAARTPRFFSCLSGLSAGGKEGLRLFFGGSRPGSETGPAARSPQLGSGAPDPGRKASSPAGRWGEETAHKSSPTGSLSASRGRVEKGETETGRRRDPARAAFKLRFHSLSQGAAANGTRARRGANQRRASSGRRPMAARVVGAWAKQAAFLGCRVWAGVGADCTWSAVLLRGLLCPPFRFAFRVRFCFCLPPPPLRALLTQPKP